MNKYANGEYTAEGVYKASGSSKSIIVKVTLDNDTIAGVTVTPNTTIKMSLGLQNRFATAIPNEVIGRVINDVHLDKLAGSSFTTKGFNDALEKIKKEAAQ